jgi:ABC-type uncharacterized transport system permease subunit
LISAASFGALSLYGYTTARSRSAMGSFLMMGLIGLVIAMLVNIFLKSTQLDFIISAIGVLIFAGLTAWDTQKIKEMYDPMEDGTIVGRKAVMGALTLYLDFINLFLFLLRLFATDADPRGTCKLRRPGDEPGRATALPYSHSCENLRIRQEQPHARGGRRRSWNQARYLLIFSRCAAGA